jgi:hypothetical protein
MTADYDKKNWFDIEKYLKRKLAYQIHLRR